MNVDLFLSGSVHRTEMEKDMMIKRIPNLIRADALHLPFKDNAFDYVYSSGLIEHVNNPVGLVFELIRVSKGKVEIRTPWRDGILDKLLGLILFRKPKKNPTHKWSFTHGWWYKLSHKFGIPLDVELNLLLPSELIIYINKRKN